MMELDKVLPRILKLEFDSLCPFCKSRAIFKTGERQMPSPSFFARPEFSEATVEVWRCGVCFKTFELF